MNHRLSASDRQFRAEFEAGTYSPQAFNHRAHVRLAYSYLAEHDADTAHNRLRSALLSFLQHHGIDVAKYHETLTRAWILAVRHFMAGSPDTDSSDDLIEQNPQLLDSQIMLSHYSADILFSEQARAEFIEPNLSPIPKHVE